MIKQLFKNVFKNEEAGMYYSKLRRYYFRNKKAARLWSQKKNEKHIDINDFEQRYYSQNGEDGIFKVIFEKIGTTNKFCVEFGIHPFEGNTIYLKKQGWTNLWMDGDGDGTTIKQEFITAENINQLFEKYHVPYEFDLLSIDIDTNDYWIWKAIDKYSPRVVAMEYNASVPPTESKVMPYNPTATWDGSDYFGASLLALKNLGEAKGYTLIGCDLRGVNSFFVRNDLVKDHFKIDPIEKAYKPAGYGRKVEGVFQGHPKSDKKMVEV